jgi:hypothetical protein
MYNLNWSLHVVGFGTGESDPFKDPPKKCVYPAISALRKSIAFWKSYVVSTW